MESVVTPRTAFEFDTGIDAVPGIVLRGVRVSGGAAAQVLLVHDLGHDLDEFATLPETLAAQGCDVVAVDLPGHGFSDGTPTDLSAMFDAVRALVAHLAGEGPLGLVASGRSATLGMLLGEPHGIAAQLLLSPVLDAGVFECGHREPSVRLVMHADGDHLAGTGTQRFFSPLIGHKMLLHHAEVAGGSRAVVNDGTLATHVRLFFHRYLLSTDRGGPARVEGRR